MSLTTTSPDVDEAKISLNETRISGAEFADIPADAFRSDPSYQRPVEQLRVNKLAQSWDDDSVGVIIASKRPDGSIATLDGQHRVAAMLQQGRGKDRIGTLLLEGLDVPAEARLFVRFNRDRRPLMPSDIFRAELAEGDPSAKEIQTVLQGLDLELRSFGSASNKHIGCVQAIRRVHQAIGAKGLDAVLGLILVTWGEPPPERAFHERLVLGIARILFYGNYGKRSLEMDSLRKILANDSPSHIVNEADQLRTLQKGGQLDRIIAHRVVDQYNKGRKTAERIDLSAMDKNKGRDPFQKATEYRKKSA